VFLSSPLALLLYYRSTIRLRSSAPLCPKFCWSRLVVALPAMFFLKYSSSHHRYTPLSCKAILASLGFKLVDKVILFQSRALVLFKSAITSSTSSGLTRIGHSFLNIYARVAFYDTAEQRQSHQPPPTHPSSLPQLYTIHLSFAPGVAPAAHLNGHGTITLRPATLLIPPKHRDTLAEPWGTISTLIFHILLHHIDFHNFLVCNWWMLCIAFVTFARWYSLSVPYSLFTLPHSVPFFTQHPTQIVLRNVCTIEKDSGVVVFFRTPTISWGYLA
jgi:hypothetical protein